jgi:hypothetical protein
LPAPVRERARRATRRRTEAWIRIRWQASRSTIPSRLGEAQAEAEVLAEDDIARRAYELSESEEGGTPEENWLRAESELRRG